MPALYRVLRPVVIRDSDTHARASPGDVVRSIGGMPVFGKSRQEVLVMHQNSGQMCLAPASMFTNAFAASGMERTVLQAKFRQDRLPFHPGAKCETCRVSPLLGARYRCKTCRVDYCGACYAGRGHSHPSQHTFEYLEYPSSTPQAAHPPPRPFTGASVVVCGTDRGDWNGKLGTVRSQELSGQWLVELSPGVSASVSA